MAAETAHIDIREETGAGASPGIPAGQLFGIGRDGTRRQATICASRSSLPTDLPLGYHDVHVRLGRPACKIPGLIVTPARAYAHPALADGGKAAGIALALYGVRSARNWGAGDLRDLHGIIDWIADDAKASFIALNPLHAIYNRRPYNTSPYLPECIFYPNYLYLDVESIPDFERSRRAHCLWNEPATQRQLAALRDSEFVEYEQVSAWKLRFLKLAFAEFLREYRAGSARAGQFRRFLADEGDLLERFATYCALDEHLHELQPRPVDMARLAGPLPGSRFARNRSLPQETLAPGSVL